MLNIFRKTTENERKEENLRTYLAKNKTGSRQYEDSLGQYENERRSSEADLRCEEAIMKDKERFGRVRTSLMKHLRVEYGNDIADRALRRINKRRTEGYFNS
ncbi:MAG: hypothetical protein ABI340_09105 [Nitrososphaera sp.]